MPGGPGDQDPPAPADAALASEAQRRYLNYAVSVITSRALPDVRDGLEARAAADPLRDVRQPAPLPRRQVPQVRDHRRRGAGQVPPARRQRPATTPWCAWRSRSRCACRWSTGTATSARWTATPRPPTATPRRASRRWRRSCSTRSSRGRSTFARTTTAPPRSRSCCRRKIPQLLVNGCTGHRGRHGHQHPAAQPGRGRATRRWRSSTTASCETKDLLKYIKGPDFPTGGQVTNSKKELREIYETGQGGIRVRGEWKTEAGGKGADTIIVTSIPYALTKSTVVERIAEVIINKKLPHAGRRARRVDRRRAHRAGAQGGRRSRPW